MTDKLSFDGLLGGILPNGQIIHANKKKKGAPSPGLDPPKLDYMYITLRGYGTHRMDSISVMCGDEPPTIMDGYAKWTTVDRPLRTGVTTFQGYNPAMMKVSLRFGVWDDGGWEIDNGGRNDTGAQVEKDISTLGWMAGANFGAGAPPYVYCNTYGPRNGSTNLVASDYQETVGAGKTVSDTKRWPWVISGGINWGPSLRNTVGSRVYQECDFTLINWQGFSSPPTHKTAGGYFRTTKKYWNVQRIAGAPSSHALDIEKLAKAILTSPMNNPVRHSKLKLDSLKLTGRIKPNMEIWVPSHVV